MSVDTVELADPSEFARLMLDAVSQLRAELGDEGVGNRWPAPEVEGEGPDAEPGRPLPFGERDGLTAGIAGGSTDAGLLPCADALPERPPDLGIGFPLLR